MSFYVEQTSNFELCPAGMHLARCYRIIDLGTQRSDWKGQVKYARKIMIGWEVHARDDNGKPVLTRKGELFGAFKNYTLSWAEKSNLRLDLQSWRGKAFNQQETQRFDLKVLVGAWCMLNMIHKPNASGSVYSNVDGVSPVPAIYKQQGLPEAVNKNQLFTLQEPDLEVFETFSDNLKTKIMSSPEWEKLNKKSEPQADMADDDQDDDIPF